MFYYDKATNDYTIDPKFVGGFLSPFNQGELEDAMINSSTTRMGVVKWKYFDANFHSMYIENSVNVDNTSSSIDEYAPDEIRLILFGE